MIGGSVQRLMQVVAVASLALLAACAQPFEARVQSFQAMPPMQGQTFVVKPLDDKLTGSLEFAAYAAEVTAALQKHGLQPAQTPEAANMVVKIEFGSGPGRERIATRPSMNPGWGWGWRGRGWYGGWPGWYGPWGPWGPWDDQEVYSFTVYPAHLHVMIQSQPDGKPLFEGHVATTTRVNDLPAAMPKLVEAMFTDFPGPPASSKVVRVPASR